MIRELATLDAIDFLPEQYRHRTVQRRAYAGRVFVACVFVAALVGLGFAQSHFRAQVEQRLLEVELQHQLAVAENAKLAEVQNTLRLERGSASLLTYLRHPWPATQVLAAVLEPLPESITLSEWRISSETVRATSLTPQSEKKETSTDASERRDRDLKRLMAEHSGRHQAVILTGHATEAAALHEYLARLEAHPLFAKVDLRSIEDLPAEKRSNQSLGAFHFTAHVILQPAHGQSASKPVAVPAAANAAPGVRFAQQGPE